MDISAKILENTIEAGIRCRNCHSYTQEYRSYAVFSSEVCSCPPPKKKLTRLERGACVKCMGWKGEPKSQGGCSCNPFTVGSLYFMKRNYSSTFRHGVVAECVEYDERYPGEGRFKPHHNIPGEKPKRDEWIPAGYVEPWEPYDIPGEGWSVGDRLIQKWTFTHLSDALYIGSEVLVIGKEEQTRPGYLHPFLIVEAPRVHGTHFTTLQELYTRDGWSPKRQWT